MTNTNTASHRSLLQKIARSAMQDKGFLVDFPAAVDGTLDKLHSKAVEINGPLRDLRSLSWCSIDNDDSEDLDQLSVAQTTQTG